MRSSCERKEKDMRTKMKSLDNLTLRNREKRKNQQRNH